MYILSYSPTNQTYQLAYCNDKGACPENAMDVLYEFEQNEKDVAQKVLNNLNLQRKEAA